jgi:6-phosphogluconate dehydrogenase
MAHADIGIVGLGVMGSNLALNMADHGFGVAGYDRNADFVDDIRRKSEAISAYESIEEFVAALKKPRRILMMVTAGSPVDWCIDRLTPHLEEGDVLIDGGNSFFEDTIRRAKECEQRGLRYFGVGVSGGEEGARHGPSLMPGGSKEAWPSIEPIFRAIAAKVADGTPCCTHLGPDGAGHFVKMVHNGIEYGDMQLICEAYGLMDRLLGLSAPEQQPIFAEWNRGELDSYLIEITAAILGHEDEHTGKPVVDVILDTAEQKGTGKWTSQIGLDLGAPIPTIAEAVFARMLSAVKEEREAASLELVGPGSRFSGDAKAFVVDIRAALYASKICSYAQGFQLLRYASDRYKWGLKYGDIALLWRGGCIIRARFLDRIKEAFDADPDCVNLMRVPFFRDVLARSQQSWRRVVAAAVEHGVPVPAMSSALAYYDGYRAERLPANLLQAQRDFFGAHTYRRIDRPRDETFHTLWKS